MSFRVLDLGVNQESLAIFSHVIDHLFGSGEEFARVGLEKNAGSCGVEVCATVYGCRHHFSVRRQVEQFLAISSPAGLGASGVGDLPLAVGFRKRGDVNLELAAL